MAIANGYSPALPLIFLAKLNFLCFNPKPVKNAVELPRSTVRIYPTAPSDSRLALDHLHSSKELSFCNTMAKDPGSTLRTARQIRVTATAKTFRDRLSPTDRVDIYAFELARRSSFNLKLTGLKSNADVVLLNQRRQIVQQSRRGGNRSEEMSTTLETGTYYIKLNQRQGSTAYRLQLSTANASPTLTTNSIALGRGAAASIDSSFLRASDSNQSATELIYTLTALPEAGRLLLNGSPLSLNATFTQEDINSNRLVYQQLGTTQLTNAQEGVSSTFLRVSGMNAAWSCSDGTDVEIFFYNGYTGVTTQLTNNDTIDYLGQLLGSSLTWSSTVGVDSELFVYDATTGTTAQITDNEYFDDFPARISETHLAFNAYDGNDLEIFLRDRATGVTTQITNNNIDDNLVADGLSGANLAWFSMDGDDFDTFFYNGATQTITQVSNSGTGIDESPGGISGSNLAIDRFDSSSGEPIGEVFFYNGATNTLTQITNNATDDFRSKISGDFVAWLAYDGQDYELKLYDAKTGLTTPLTNNDTDERWFALSGSNVFWSSFDGSDQELFFYNGATTTQLTRNTSSDFVGDISGFSVGWESEVNGRAELFFSSYAPSDRFSFTVSDGLGGTASGSLNLTINP